MSVVVSVNGVTEGIALRTSECATSFTIKDCWFRVMVFTWQSGKKEVYFIGHDVALNFWCLTIHDHTTCGRVENLANRCLRSMFAKV